MANGVDGEAEGGEAACYLPLLNESGDLADPRMLIRLAGANAPNDHVRVVRIGGAEPSSPADPLAPLAGETTQAYRERLEMPKCRTAAWGIILAMEDEPIAIEFADEKQRAGYGPILVNYLRSLIE